MHALRLKMLEATLGCIVLAVGLLWSHFAMTDHLIWLLDYAAVPGFAFVATAIEEYLHASKISKRIVRVQGVAEWHPDWLSLTMVVIAGVAMMAVFGRVGVDNRPSVFFSWPQMLLFAVAILAGTSAGKCVVMYRARAGKTVER